MEGAWQWASLEGAFRIAREQATDALLQVLLAHQSPDTRRSAAELRNHAHGIVLGLQELLVKERFFVGFAEELGGVLYGLTTGSEDALIEIATHLDTSLQFQVPTPLLGELRQPIARLISRVMAGWIGRSQQTPEQRDERVRAARELAGQERGDDLLRRVIEQSPLGLKVLHLESGALVVHNPALERLFGFTLEEEMLLPPELLKNAESAEDDFDLLSDMLAGRIPYVERISARPHKDGRSVPFRMVGWPIRDAEGNVTHIADAFTSGDRREPETEGSGLSEKRARYLLQLSSDPIVVVTPSGEIRYASPSVETAFGHAPDWLVGKHMSVIVMESSYLAGQRMLDECLSVPRSRVVSELAARRSDGTIRWHETVATNLLDVEEIQGVVIQGRDITERLALQQELEIVARTDGLTGLLNRRGFDERLRDVLARDAVENPRSDRVSLICYTDLDVFKQINDRFGHTTGDIVLAEVGRALQDLVKGYGFAGRMGGDEFVIHAQLPDSLGVDRFLERLVRSLSGTIEVDGRHIVYTGTYGAVIVGGRAGHDADRLIGMADQELGRAKASGVPGRLSS